MNQHTYRKVQKNYVSQSKFSSTNRHGGDHAHLQRDDHHIQQIFESDQPEVNLHYELIHKSINYPSQTSFQDLASMKTILLDLVDEFKLGNKRVVIDGDRKDNYEKRLLLLENQLNGLMKKKIIFQAPDREGGTRKLDYANLLNEKQNQIVELEKKISNLEERLRRRDQRQLQLENQITFLHNKVKAKNSIIQTKEKQITDQTAFSNKLTQALTNVRSSIGANHELSRLILQSVPSLDKNQIKVMSSRISSSHGSDIFSNEIIKLARGLENLSSKNGSMEKLQGFIEGWILGLPEQNLLRKKIIHGQGQLKNQDKIRTIEDKFKYAGEIYRRQIDTLRRKNPQVDIGYETEIIQTLKDQGSRVSVGNGGIIQVQKNVVKTVEVPVQDAKTKNLIFQLATEMKKIYSKYPKLYGEIDPRLAQFFSQQLIDVISVDEIDRVVSVVKYEPQVVRVENVYAYNSEKNRKVQFHLRVLLKALLTEMEKMIGKTGIVPEIDEGVIGLIKEQIMDVVDVDDILKVYRTVPKIVEVEKVIEKVVEKIVEVPKLVPTETRVQVPIEVQKYNVVENIKNVPIEVPKVQTVYVEKLVQAPQIVQKIVEVPRIVEKIVEVVRQVPKLQYVDRIVEKIVEVQKIVQVEKEVIVRVPQYHEVVIEKEKIVPTQKIVQVLKPIEVIVDRVQEVVKEIPKIVEVQKIKEVIVEKPIYYEAPKIEHQIVTKYEPIDRIIEKIVPVIKVEDRIIQVPQIVEKIVEVRDVIRQPPIQVQVLKEVPVYKEVIKPIQVIVEKPVIERHQVEKVIEKFIQIPIVHEIIKVQTQIVKEPIIQRIQSVIYKEIEVEKPVVLYQDRIIEVDKIINHFIKEPQVVTIHEEKIIPLETVVKEPIAVPTIVEKVIQKLVEVPKVVEVEKIVQKIVPVPRVVEKVIQVEKIIQKIVNKPIIQEKITEIQRIVEIPVIQEKVVEIEVPRNIYIENEVPVQVKEEILVKDQIRIETPQIHQIQQPPRIVVERRQVPIEMMIEKIVPLAVPQTNAVLLQKQIVVPIEIQIPVDLEKEKLVPVEHVRHQIVEVQRQRQVIVPKEVERDPRIIEVDRYEQKILVEKEPQILVEEKPYFQTVIKQVKTFQEKVVQIVTENQKLVRVPEMCDRLIDRVIREPEIYEVQRVNDRVIKIPEIVEIQKIVPHIVNVNSYIESIVEKIVDIPILIEKWKDIERIQEKIVQVNTTNTEIKQVDKVIEKAVIQEKIKQTVDRIHVTEEILKVAEKMIVKDADPVLVTQEKVMEVPFVVQKIVQKIVVMPQIVQVLKYVHQITEQADLGVAVSADIGKQQVQFKSLASNVRAQMNKLLVRLKHLWTIQPQLKGQIEIIQRFLAEFEKLILYPKIHEVIRQKVVEKPVEKKTVVTVPTGSTQNDFRMELSKAILIEKLLIELRRIREENPKIKFNLDQDIKLIFGSELGGNSGLVGSDVGKMIGQYSNTVQSKFKSMGGWTTDHQMMLNSFLQERFLMANILRTANSDLSKTKAISQKRLDMMRKYKYQRDQMEKAYQMLNAFLPSVLDESLRVGNRQNTKKIEQWMSLSSKAFTFTTLKGGQPTRQVQKIDDLRLGSMMREKQQQIIRLKQQIRQLIVKSKKTGTTQDNQRLFEYQRKIKDLEKRIFSYERLEREHTEKIYTLERDLQRLRHIEKVHKNCDDEMKKLVVEINQLRRKYEGLKKSRTTGSPIRDSDRHKSQSSSSSSYGVNYMDYANIDENANRGVGKIEGTPHVYKSSYAFGTGERQREGYGNMSQSRGETSSQRYQTSYRHDYSGDGAQYRTFEYGREEGNRSSGGRGMDFQMQGDERGTFYETSSKEMIKKVTYGKDNFRK